MPYAKKPVGDSALKQVLKLDESDTFEGLDFDQLSPVSLQDAMMAKMASDPSRRTDSCFSTHLDLLGGNRYQMSRDCLTMDIYKPVTEKKNLPVFVWIHGGGFVSGSKQEYNGEILCALHEMIVIIPQYRLHFLGFFQDSLGFKDLKIALEFVNSEILSFNGDPGNVHIAGESAGACAASYIEFKIDKNSGGVRYFFCGFRDVTLFSSNFGRSIIFYFFLQINGFIT